MASKHSEQKKKPKLEGLKRYSAALLASVALIGLMPTEALACKWHDVKCKAREAKKKIEREANKAKEEAQKAAERAEQEAKAAAARAAEEAQRQAQQAYQTALDAAFRDLRDAGLGALADVNKFKDPDFWLRETTRVLVNNVATDAVMDAQVEVTRYITSQLGNFSESAPFGDGHVGRQLQTEVEKTYRKAIHNVAPLGEKVIDYLNPRKNPITPDPSDYEIAKDTYRFDIPSFMRFSYGTALQIKPVDIAVDVDKRIPILLKGSVQSTFPLLWGDRDGASSIFVNAIQDKKFKFQVGIALGVGSKKAEGDDSDPRFNLQEGLNFDVTCSTAVLNKCQLTKISSKLQAAAQRKPGTALTGKIKRAMSSVAAVQGPMVALGVITESQGRALVNVVEEISSTAGYAASFVDFAADYAFMPDDVATKALKRQSDMGAIGYFFAAVSAFDLNTKKETKKGDAYKNPYKETLSISDVESADISRVYEWHNADYAKGVFKPGFSFIGNNPLPDFQGLELSLKIGTEMKAKAGFPDILGPDGKKDKDAKVNESEIGISANLSTSSSLGVMFPIKANAMDLGKSLWSAMNGDTALNEASMKRMVEQVASDGLSFGDRIGLGASKNWKDSPELQGMNAKVENLSDKLNAGSYFVIMSRNPY